MKTFSFVYILVLTALTLTMNVGANNVTTMTVADNTSVSGWANYTEISTTSGELVSTVTPEIVTYPELTMEEVKAVLIESDPMCTRKALAQPFQSRLKAKFGNLTTNWILCLCIGNFCPDMTIDEITKKSVQHAQETAVVKYDSFTIAAIVSYGAVIAVGFVGNMLVILTILIMFRPVNITNMFILSLSLADVLVCCICVPLRLHDYILATWLHGEAACKIVMYLYYALFMCSVFTLTGMSVERWFVICFPMKAQYISTISRTRVIIISAWIVAFLCAIPVAFHTLQEVADCSIIHSREGNWSGELYLYIMLAVFVLPCFVIGFAYFHTSVVLWKSLKVSQKLKGENGVVDLFGLEIEDEHPENAKGGGSTEARSRIQVIRLLIVIWVIFVLCWGPFLMYNVLLTNAEHVLQITVAAHNHLYSALNLTSMANSAVNPLLYAFMSRQFRHGFACLLTCKPLRPKRDTSTYATGVSAISMSTKTTEK